MMHSITKVFLQDYLACSFTRPITLCN